MTDVTGLIGEDHARILRLFAVLDDLARDRDRGRDRCGQAGLAGTWDRLASLLALHIQAEEEICYVPLLPDTARLRDATAPRHCPAATNAAGLQDTDPAAAAG